MKLEKVLGKLKESKLAIFTINDLLKVTDLSKCVAYVYINRMVNRGLIYKIERGKFTIYNDPFLVSTQLLYPSYISFLTGLFLHGKTTQTINEILVATSKRKNSVESFGLKIKFVKLNPKFMFGFNKVEKGSSYIFLAKLEKVILDSLYLPRYCPLSDVYNALKEADIDKLLMFASELKVEAINRRLGYMLEVLGVRTNLVAQNRTPYKLNPAIKSLGEFNKKWRLYVNEVLE
ncbi:MAG: hypothetical protein QXJ17_08700 [Nitrososphaeria archaeon]